mmetsp:Transcript_31897/g.32143  ORF Transcript_31897/g.32143 Transcript_31897/m.32143 type:complete len:90 (-) Transcript_31897:26-295(-)
MEVCLSFSSNHSFNSKTPHIHHHEKSQIYVAPKQALLQKTETQHLSLSNEYSQPLEVSYKMTKGTLYNVGLALWNAEVYVQLKRVPHIE